MRLEGIEIRIVDKIDNGEFSVRYTTHVQDIGWMGYKNQPEMSGTTGQLRKVEAIKIVGKNVPEGVKIKYKSHYSKNWKGDKNEIINDKRLRYPIIYK